MKARELIKKESLTDADIKVLWKEMEFVANKKKDMRRADLDFVLEIISKIEKNPALNFKQRIQMKQLKILLPQLKGFLK